jgi:hypothetical protein
MQHQRLFTILAGLVLLAAAPPAAHAQEQDVARGSFPFFARTLTIAVNAKMAGELQILRSRAARVDIAALAAPGVATFAIGGYSSDELRLTAAGADHAVFIVTVPERVYVSVRAPGTSRSFGAFMPVETVEWEGVDSQPARLPAAPTLPGRDGLYHVYGAGVAPTVVVLPSLDAIRRLDIRIEGAAFSVASSRPLSVQPGQADPLVIDIDDGPASLILRVPAGSEDFRIAAGGLTILAIRRGKLVEYCSPATVQSLDQGRTHILLTPSEGRLSCPTR